MKALLTFLFVSVLIITFAGNGETDVAETTKTEATTIVGKVIDKTTGEALVGVQVSLADGKTYYTDFEGNFVIQNAVSASCTISTNYISYQNNVIKNVKPSSENAITIELLPVATK